MADSFFDFLLGHEAKRTKDIPLPQEGPRDPRLPKPPVTVAGQLRKAMEGYRKFQEMGKSPKR